MTTAEEPARLPAPSQRRLQRPPDATGRRLTRFSEVFLRHGLPVLLAGALCLLLADQRELLRAYLLPAARAPLPYLVGAVGVFVGCLLATLRLDRRVSAAQLGWIAYLLALSIWEEWVFRLALPHALAGTQLAMPVAVVVANLAFGALHWVTLRWRLRWCVMAFLGGLAFSRQMAAGDFTPVVLTHWLVTFLNTPRPPGGTRSDPPARQT